MINFLKYRCNFTSKFTNYNNKKYIMKDDKIYEKWGKFIKKYRRYFKSNEEIWEKNLNDVKKYIDENKKKPSGASEYDKVKKMGLWISHQQKNYNKKLQIMENDKICKKWKNFVEKYF